MVNANTSNFAFLSRHSPELVEIASRAERYFASDPITSLIWTRQFGECLAELVAARSGLLIDSEESQVSLLNRLRREAGYPLRVIDAFHFVRRAGNSAVHDRQGDHKVAIDCLKKCRELGIWFHMTFGGHHQGIGTFVAPSDKLATREEIDALRREVETALDAARTAAAASAEAELKLKAETGDRETWQHLAVEAEREKVRALAELAALQIQVREMQDRSRPRRELPPARFELREDGTEFSASAIADAFQSSERHSLRMREADPVYQIRRTFNLRLKKIQGKFESISPNERAKLSKLAQLAAMFMD